MNFNENLKFIAIKSERASSKLLKISTIPQLNLRAIQDLASLLIGDYRYVSQAAAVLAEEYVFHTLCPADKSARSAVSLGWLLSSPQNQRSQGLH